MCGTKCYFLALDRAMVYSLFIFFVVFLPSPYLVIAHSCFSSYPGSMAPPLSCLLPAHQGQPVRLSGRHGKASWEACPSRPLVLILLRYRVVGSGPMHVLGLLWDVLRFLRNPT